MRNIDSKAMTVGMSLVVVQSFLDLRLRGDGGASPEPEFSSDACGHNTLQMYQETLCILCKLYFPLLSIYIYKFSV